MADSEEESEGNESEPDELDPVAILEGLKKQSCVNANVTDTVEEVDAIHSTSPVGDKTGINRAVDRTPFSVETGTDRAFMPMEISGGRDDTDSKEDSLGPSDILKQIRLDKARKYEEDRLAKSKLPHGKMERIGNLKTEEESFERTIVYSPDIKGLTRDSDHVSIECLNPIHKIIEEALVYLNALDSLKHAFGKNSDCRAF
jgi:hypothetical protein